MRRPPSPPQHRYVTPRSAPIGANGVAQNTISTFASTTGSASAPAQFTILNSVVIPAGTYTVNWSVTLSGTTGAAEVNNFLLVLPGRPGITSVNGSAAGTYAQTPVTFTTTGGTAFLQTGGNNATAGSTYSESLTPVTGSATVRVGPSGVGTRWFPQQITLATTSGPADTSTAIGYLGPVAAPSQVVFTSYKGGGDVQGLAIPMMQPGDLLTVVWTGGKPGDAATLVIIGDQSVLSPG